MALQETLLVIPQKGGARMFNERSYQQRGSRRLGRKIYTTWSRLLLLLPLDFLFTIYVTPTRAHALLVRAALAFYIFLIFGYILPIFRYLLPGQWIDRRTDQYLQFGRQFGQDSSRTRNSPHSRVSLLGLFITRLDDCL